MRTAMAWLLCHLIYAALWPPIWQGVAIGYAGDSFWTLSLTGRAAVGAISGLGLAGLGWIIAAKTRWMRRRFATGRSVVIWIGDVAIGLLLFAVLFSVSPQIFYVLYRLIIPDLPAQWVISGLINWDRLGDVMLPRRGAAMADHVAAVAFAGVAIFTTYLHRR